MVSSTEVSPHLVRIVAGGPGFEQYNDNDFTDKYVKILFADPAHGLTPPYDLEVLREQSPEQLPTRRTYTVRESDRDAQTLTIDFVVHGDEGVAGPWARAAQPGDLMVLTGAGGGYTPEPDASWHLLIGDLTAVPAISAALEALPDDAVGHVFIETENAEDLAGLREVAGVPVTHVAPYPGVDRIGDALVEAVRALEWRDGIPQAFVHGERETIKVLRRHLVDEREIPRERLSISAYWARGRVEDDFQAEKREAIGQIG
ncbi:siderophore-interacting protein [Epidermidibacterium keratini]